MNAVYSTVYPTVEHQRAAEAVVDFYRSCSGVEAVLLVNSCARGQATPQSCLDMAVLVPAGVSDAEMEAMDRQRQDLFASHVEFERLRQHGPFAVLHLDHFNGCFASSVWDDGGGPDGFELSIGNRLVYGVSLWESGGHLTRLKSDWLPYYGDSLRQQRLTMVKHACLADLEHIAWYVERGLYFAAFDRLYRAFQEFLQALFITHRVYPLAYNKWIREQVEGILALPDVYRQLPSLFQISQLESRELTEKAEMLKALVAALNDEGLTFQDRLSRSA